MLSVPAGPGVVGRPAAAVGTPGHRLHLLQQVLEYRLLAVVILRRPLPRPVDPHVGELPGTAAEEQVLLRTGHPAGVLLAPALDVEDVGRPRPGVDDGGEEPLPVHHAPNPGFRRRLPGTFDQARRAGTTRGTKPTPAAPHPSTPPPY